MQIELAGEPIELLSEKAVFWPREKFLFLSDIHFGKSESLQAMGIPLPSGTHQDDMHRLEDLLQKTEAEQIYILGDLIHQKNSWTTDLFTDLQLFFSRHANKQWHLLIGNHERGSISYLKQLPLQLWMEDLRRGPFVLTHGHELNSLTSTEARIQGHIHPVVKINQGAIRLRLPCFVQEKNSLVLPAFGSFTGGYEMERKKGRRLYAITPQNVFEVH